MNFIDFFRQQLNTRSSMPFVEFMHHALYAPHVGYYSAGHFPFGTAGDFITAPELTPLFGYTLANQCCAILSELQHPVLFEFGAGSGRLCVDILTRLQQLNALPNTYYILEVSAALKHHQQQFIQQAIPQLAHRVQWLERWPNKPFQGVIIANEVLDAMPVHRFLKTDQGLFESYIQLHEALTTFEEIFLPCDNQLLKAHLLPALNHEQRPYLSEANLCINDWLKQCVAMLSSGVFLIIDYGFPRHEYYHPDRHQGTLMCHRQHQAHPNPLQNPGQEDITAHVDFTHVAEAAHDAGFQISGYTNQASFLLGNDLLSFLNTQNQQAIRKLTDPSEMGELFKVMALTKNFEEPLAGFQLHDKRASL